MAPRDSLDIARQAEQDQKARENAAGETAAQQALIDMRLGPAADDTEFQQKIGDSQPFFAWGSTKRERRERLTDYEDALRQGRAMYDPQTALGATSYTQDSLRSAPQGGQTPMFPMAGPDGQGVDPSLGGSFVGSGRSPGDMALEQFINSLPADDGGGPRGPAGPRGPSIYDLQKGGIDRLLASQKEGFGQQRDLMGQLADLREQGISGQEQFAKDTAGARETFLGEQDATRKEKEQQRSVERETQKSTELARQRSQLDEALRATGVDTNAATARLESLGIDPGQFADRETNETTAMLYSQSMSSANFVNQMDAISQSAAQFASDANDQATAQAMFGIGQDLSASLQTINQARQQGLIDDAMALQAIADQERTAEQQYDTSLTSLNVQTAQAAQAAAAAAARRAEQQAAQQRKLQVGAAALGALQGYQFGDEIDADALYAITEAGLGDAFLDITSGAVDQDQALEIIGANLDADLARDQFGASLSSPSGGMVLPGGMELGDFLDVYSKAGPEQQADLAPYIEQILMAQVGATE